MRFWSSRRNVRRQTSRGRIARYGSDTRNKVFRLIIVDFQLALALHPDKNGAPGADEAFKSVSVAFAAFLKNKFADHFLFDLLRSGVQGIPGVVG